MIYSKAYYFRHHLIIGMVVMMQLNLEFTKKDQKQSLKQFSNSNSAKEKISLKSIFNKDIQTSQVSNNSFHTPLTKNTNENQQYHLSPKRNRNMDFQKCSNLLSSNKSISSKEFNHECHVGREITLILRENLDVYLKDIEDITSCKIGDEQRQELKKYISENRFFMKSIIENKISRRKFGEKKAILLSTWSQKNNKNWPKYKQDIIDNSKIHRRKGWNYDAHHIIELSFGGPAEWWNIHPAESPKEHQYGIHRGSGPASKIFEKLI